MTDFIATARDLLSKTVDSLVLLSTYCGLTEDDIHKAVSDSFRRQKVSESLPGAGTTVSPQGSAALGAMLSTWRSHPDYVDAAGAPLEISRCGPSPSLEDLFARTIAANPELEEALDRDTIIDLFIASEVLDERPDQRFWPNRSWFKTNAPGAAAALTHLGYLAEFSATVTRNTEIDGDGREHIITRVRRFPASMVSMVRAMINDQGVPFIESVDDFLEKESRRGLSDERTVHIGVGLYLFTEDNQPQ